MNLDNVKCAKCGGRVVKNGHRANGKQKYICANKSECGCSTTVNTENFISDLPASPKVLLLDLENAPLFSWIWRTYKQVVYPRQVEHDWFCLVWAAKWLNEDEIFSGTNTYKNIKSENDKTIITDLWTLVDEADVIIAHNAIRYDRKRMNTRFAYNGLTPPLPYQTIDTLRIIKSQFALSDNSLDGVCKFFGLHEKQKVDFELWTDVMKGVDGAIDIMTEYCKNDVVALESLYLKVRPWMKSHPNLAIFVESTEPVCPVCLNKNLIWKGHYGTSVSLFKAFRCDESHGGCGAIGRMRTTSLQKDKRKNLTVSTAR